MSTGAFLQRVPFQAPEWSAGLKLVPTEKVALAMTPTPVHRWNVPGVPEGVELHIKRDDLSGMQLSGNKVSSASAVPP